MVPGFFDATLRWLRKKRLFDIVPHYKPTPICDGQLDIVRPTFLGVNFKFRNSDITQYFRFIINNVITTETKLKKQIAKSIYF